MKDFLSKDGLLTSSGLSGKPLGNIVLEGQTSGALKEYLEMYSDSAQP
jgi:hypothetical protein